MSSAAPDAQLASFARGVTALDRGQQQEALAHLLSIQKPLPQLADYVAYYTAAAYAQTSNQMAVLESLEPVWRMTGSPLAVKAVPLAVRALIQQQRPAEARQLVQRLASELPEATADLLLAQSVEAAGDLRYAARLYQRVYYQQPLSAEANEAGAAIARLTAQSPQAVPEPAPEAALRRADRLLRNGSPALARRELETLLPRLTGADLELARVRIGAADEQSRQHQSAYEYLTGLSVTNPQADAERLFYAAQAARRLNRYSDAYALLQEMGRRSPESPLRLEALIALANVYLIEDDATHEEPLFRDCYGGFPNDPRAAYCHWRVTWRHYRTRQADTEALLRTHLQAYPKAETAGSALYFLGRLSEQRSDFGFARGLYQELAERFPNTYYGMLARERLQDSSVRRAAVPASAEALLHSIGFSPKPSLQFPTNAMAQWRFERARLLTSAGLNDLAEGELRYGAARDGQPATYGLELARLSNERGAPEQALRFVKRYVPNFLYVPLDKAPSHFWQYAFPLPFRAELERYAREQSLDPFTVAALIRQESEFDPRAISRAKAYGLTQVMPATGRQLSRTLGIRGFTANMLFNPAINLQLGTYYLRQLLVGWDGRWELALASYNAGKSRAVRWLAWGQFREPAEFVETIPFTETRGYVQSVLRNADVYRRLYAK